MPQAEPGELRRNELIGVGLIVGGLAVTIGGALFSHFTSLPPVNAFNAEIYPNIPRGWLWTLIGQTVSLGGGLAMLAGITIGFLYKRPMTWARAAIGASVFTTLMIILFGIIPNQWLTLTQAVWEWTPQKIILTVPEALVLNNEVKISAAVLKDAIAGGYVVVVTGIIAVGMYQWQERSKRVETAPPPAPVSTYGRPLTKVGR
ncbi:MAG TPA: hypothetical protein VGC47_10830 [Acidimicrobiia bacterium]|jgi:hypothetical protein